MNGRPVSKGLASFTVTAAGGTLQLDDSGEASASFTVTNTRAQTVTGRLLARPSEPAKPEWFSIVGESIRDFTPNAAEEVVVKLDVPPESPPASYSFRLDAVAEDNPDEDYTEGPSVAFDVEAPPPSPKKKFPWWILIVGGAIVLVLVVGVVVVLLRNPGSSDLTIIDAQYVDASGKGANVTKRLNRRIRNGRLDVIVDNDTMGGDPSPFQPKKLIVVYRTAARGVATTATFQEGTRAVIP
jgi:hypothetical protein